MTSVHRSVTATEPEGGHTSGTAAPQTLERQGRASQPEVHQAVDPGWPRLLNVEEAARYLGISFWTMREFVNAGSIPTVRLPRPRTDRMRRRRPVTDTVRRLLIDRLDLDALVECWKERQLP
jgi:excisionase family DNA binding protein